MQNAEMVIGKLVFLVSYLLTIPIIGYCRAWVANKVGDDTASELGFNTLNPERHVSFFWIILMNIIPGPSIGFGQYVPINVANIHGPKRRMKLVAAYLSDAFAGMLLSLFALFGLIAFYGESEFLLSAQVLMGRIPFSLAYGTHTSYAMTLGLFLSGFVIFNSMLAAFNIIVNLFYLGVLAYFPNGLQFGEHVEWIVFVGPLILLLVCWWPMFQAILTLTAVVGHMFAVLIGA